jgi:hypothetical protein
MEPSTIYQENGFIFSEEQVGNDPTGLTPLQTLLSPHVPLIEFLLWALWIITFIFVLKKLCVINSNSEADTR